MKGLLMDNWSLEKAVRSYQNYGKNHIMYAVELVALIEALVLWDEVYYWDNGRTFWHNTISTLPDSIKNCLHPLRTPNLFLDTADADTLLSDYCEDSIVADASIKYLQLADRLSLSYLPVDKRAQFILENDLYAVFGQIYSRTDMFNSVDKDIRLYYHSLNEEIKKTKLKFTPHCLFQFVVENCDENSDIFEVARELGRDKTVRRFKEWVTTFEDEIAAGKYIEIYRFKDELHTIEDKLINQRSRIEFDVSVGLPFAFSVSLSIPFSKAHPELVFPVSVFKNALRIN